MESRGHKLWKLWTQTVTNRETMKFRWKSPTQITKVANTNHLDKMFATKSMTSPRQTRLCHSNGIWPVTMHGESRKESPKVRDKFADLLPTQIMKVGDVICVTVFHDLSTNLSRTLSQSRRHGIWALSASCGIFVCFNYLCVSSIVLSVSFATMFFIGE